jgi:hypothetical protein
MGFQHFLRGKGTLGMIKIAGMKKSERIRIRRRALRTKLEDTITGMIMILIIGAANKKFLLSKASGKKTIHDIVSFCFCFIQPAEMRPPIAGIFAKPKIHSR